MQQHLVLKQRWAAAIVSGQFAKYVLCRTACITGFGKFVAAIGGLRSEVLEQAYSLITTTCNGNEDELVWVNGSSNWVDHDTELVSCSMTLIHVLSARKLGSVQKRLMNLQVFSLCYVSSLTPSGRWLVWTRALRW